MRSKVAVVILNWNGETLLKKFLPGVIKHSFGADVYVIDNASSDGSIAYLNSLQNVSVIRNPYNMGFAGGYNEGLKNIDAEYFVLLNSDVEVKSDWVSPVIKLMDTHPEVAVCQPKIKDQKNPDYFEYAGAAGGFIDKYGFTFCRGRIFDTIEEDKGQYNESSEIFWASGAALFIRSHLYKEAGGLDKDFFAHMEEIDLCWRLKNKGHKIWYCHESEVFHVGGATLNKMNAHKTYLNFRNNLFLLIKNDLRRTWFWYFMLRMILDGVAGGRFLLLGEVRNFIAVLKAHGSVYVSFFRFMKKRNQLKKNTIKNTNWMGFFLPFSTVFLYFIKGQRRYDDIMLKSF